MAQSMIYFILVFMGKAVFILYRLLPVFFVTGLYILGKNYSLNRITYRRFFSETGVFEGEAVCFIEEVTNHSFLPVFRVDIESLVMKEIWLPGSPQQEDQSVQNFISRFTIMPFTTVRRTHRAIGGKRGFYQLETAQIIFLKRTILLKSEAELAVYPKQLSYSCTHRLDCYMQAMEVTRVPLLTDPFSFSGIREYRVGDAFHTINFKATARHGGNIYVNQTDFITGRRQMLYLNFETIPNISSESYKNYMETALSYSAYLLEQAFSNGFEVGFAANCHMFYGKKYLYYPIFRGNGSQNSYQEILKELASVVIRRGQSISSMMLMDAKGELNNTEIILMTLALDKRTEEAIRLLEAFNNQVRIIWLQEV